VKPVSGNYFPFFLDSPFGLLTFFCLAGLIVRARRITSSKGIGLCVGLVTAALYHNGDTLEKLFSKSTNKAFAQIVD